MKCKTEVLLINGSMSVGQCTDCKRVGVHFNNLLAGFQPDGRLRAAMAIYETLGLPLI